MKTARFACVAALLCCAGLATTASAQLARTGHPVYTLPSASAPGVKILPLISNGNGTGGLPAELYGAIDANDALVPAQTYQFIGIPDGMGIYNGSAGQITLVVNHELGATASTTHAHGSRGSLISKWRIDGSSGNINGQTATANDFTVIGGRDGNLQYNLFTLTPFTRDENGSPVVYPANSYVPFNATFPMPNYNPNATFGVQGWEFPNPSVNGTGRYCSADLAEPGAYLFTNAAGETFGTTDRIFMNGEEIGRNGRALAHVLTGPEKNQAFELPRLGHCSWENSVASPFPQLKTIVVGCDDDGATSGNVFFYVGTKQATGTTIEKAGLTNGNFYGLAITGTTNNAESPTLVLGANGVRRESAPFTLYNFGDVTSIQGSTTAGIAGIQEIGDQNNVIGFNRVEDGQWDPANPNRFIFVTTAAVGVPSRIWAVDFTDITQPELGGTVTMLGDGQDQSSFAGGFFAAPSDDRSSTVNADGRARTMEMADNFGIYVGADGVTRLLIQEDVGGNARLGRLWMYDTGSDGLVEIGINNVALFGNATWPNGSLVTNFTTLDEECSGMIDAQPFFGRGWFIQNMQAHYNIPGELVQGGQVMAVYVPDSVSNPTLCNYDYNRDENIDLTDAQQMAQVFVGLLAREANWLDGDLNRDNNADLTDAQILANFVVTGNCQL
jgi:hypothetical protein